MTAIKMFNIKRNKIKVNPYGIENYNLKKIKTILMSLTYLMIIKITLSCRIIKDKGLKNIAKLQKKLSNKKIKFIFLGGYRDENYYQNILKKYSEYVIFPGMRTDIERFYKSSYLFLFLSHRVSRTGLDGGNEF